MNPNVKFFVDSQEPVYGAVFYGPSFAKAIAKYEVRFDQTFELKEDDEIEQRFVRIGKGVKVECWLHRKGEEPKLLGTSP